MRVAWANESPFLEFIWVLLNDRVLGHLATKPRFIERTAGSAGSCRARRDQRTTRIGRFLPLGASYALLSMIAYQKQRHLLIAKYGFAYVKPDWPPEAGQRILKTSALRSAFSGRSVP